MFRHRTYVALVLALASAPGCEPRPEPARDDLVAESFAPAPPRRSVGRSVPELVRDIGKDGLDGSAGNHTPAGDELIAIGGPAIEPVLDVMLSPVWADRACAERVLREITAKQYGWGTIPNWSSSPAFEHWRTFWNRLGPLRADDSYRQRSVSVRLWRDWLDWERFRR